MKLIDLGKNRVVIELTSKELLDLFDIASNFSAQYDDLDEGLLNVTLNEASELSDGLHEIVRSLRDNLTTY